MVRQSYNIAVLNTVFNKILIIACKRNGTRENELKVMHMTRLKTVHRTVE